MYPFNGNGTVNRLPKSKPEVIGTSGSSLGKTVGTTLVQAMAIVVAIKLVDAVVEIAMSRFRKPRPDQPARNRKEEHSIA